MSSPKCSYRARKSVYQPGGVLIHALSVSIPWITALFLFGLLIVFHRSVAVTPGVLFDLPQAPLRGGSQNAFTAMMIPVGSENRPGGQDTLLFFDDDRFLTSDLSQLEALAERLRQVVSLAQKEGDGTLLLLADKRVSHGEVMRFVSLAREAGVRKVNVAIKPE